LKLKTKLQVALLLVAALCILLSGWQSFKYSRNAIEATTFARLTGIRETKKQHIESYVNQIRYHIAALAEDNTTIEATNRFIREFRSLRGTVSPAALRASLKAPRSPVTGVHRTFAHDTGDAHSAYHPFFYNVAHRFGYSDILLADATTGDVVYTVAGRSDLASTLRDGHSNISQAFAEANVADKSDSSRLVDFAHYDAADSLPAAFIASPIFDAGRRIGVLIFELSIHDINDIMTSGARWQEEDLGKTGETYIVGADFLMRNDSRLFVQDSASYFRRLQQVGTPESTVAEIRARSTTVLLQQARTEATIDALTGHTNTRLITDYRGVPVLSSYAPLHIPGLTWVMLAEIDAHEALASVAALRETLIFAGLALLLLAAVVGSVLARMISRPLVTLALATERFGRGETFQRVPVSSADEIGILAQTVNRMAERMTDNTEHLRREINERKRAEDDLRHSREKLRSLSTHLQSVREEERQGVAREIHDELGQALSTLKLDLALMKEELYQSPIEAEKRISMMSEVCDTTIRAVRRIITQLRPRLLDDLGLTAAIEWQSEEFLQRTGIRYSLSIIPEEVTLDALRSTALFRIFQETLTNIARHSGATAVTIQLHLNDTGVTLNINDNGKGITEQQVHGSGSFGLLGIRERAQYWGGFVTINGEPMQGTRVSVFLPGDFTTRAS
jgi:signal transduction histidine kinase